ncbi:MAG: carboxypeptidase-like regulatory domain-containing protein, partial [Terriglobia bacterium]
MSEKTFLACGLFLMVGFIGLSQPAQAQVFASLSGTAYDQSGADLPGVTVIARNVETGLVRKAVTGDQGRYDLVSLPIGKYELTAEKDGFRSEVHKGISLVVGQEAIVNLILQLGEVRQQVTVTGEAPEVSATTTEISGLVGESQVKNLPLNGRSYDELLTLDPGIVNYTWEKTGGVGVSNSTVGNMF